jgi:hypothetical protein
MSLTLLAALVVTGAPPAAALAPECTAPFEGATARCELAWGGFPVEVSVGYRGPSAGDHLVVKGTVTAVLVGGVSYLLFACEDEGHGEASCTSTQYREWSAVQANVPEQAVKLVCEASVENHGSGGHSHGPSRAGTKASGRTACASGAAV